MDLAATAHAPRRRRPPPTPHAAAAHRPAVHRPAPELGEALRRVPHVPQFKTGGALHYIDLIQQALPEVEWGRRSRVVLDVGCGVASFGGFLFERGALTMSFAPKDEHEAQVQFALERGIPAISAVMGTKRLQFPGNVFDIVHCARCRVPWHIDGGLLLLEANRLVRPGGFFVWSATPVYQKLPEDVEIWEEMVKLCPVRLLLAAHTVVGFLVGAALPSRASSSAPPSCSPNTHLG